MQSCLPFFYHPTTVLLVNDDRNYLRQLQSLLSKNPLKFLIEPTPQNALQIIYQNISMQTSFRHCFQYLEEEEFETYRMSVNVSDIHKMIYDKDRFDQISTVIIDYNMPGMNSLEFCKKIHNTPIRKILLIEEADEMVAVEAFNKGLIDACVRKHQDSFSTVIGEVLEKCQESYFSDFSKKIEAIFDPEDQKKSPLRSEKFKNYFKNIVQTQKIKEFYLLERTGSFLYIDEEGNHGVLEVKLKESAELFLDSQEAATAAPEILKSLKEGTHILCYKQVTKTPLPAGSSWGEYTFQADRLDEEDETFLCAYVPGKFGLQKDQFQSFQGKTPYPLKQIA